MRRLADDPKASKGILDHLEDSLEEELPEILHPSKPKN
jgi:hypothetical protein